MVITIALSGCNLLKPEALKPVEEVTDALPHTFPQYQFDLASNGRSGKTIIETTQPALLFEGSKGAFLLIDEKPTNEDSAQQWIINGITTNKQEAFSYAAANKSDVLNTIVKKFALKQVKRFEYDQVIVLEQNNVELVYSVQPPLHTFTWVNYTADIAQLKKAIAQQDIAKIKQLNIPTSLIPAEVLRTLYESIQNSSKEDEIARYEEIMRLIYNSDQ